MLLPLFRLLLGACRKPNESFQSLLQTGERWLVDVPFQHQQQLFPFGKTIILLHIIKPQPVPIVGIDPVRLAVYRHRVRQGIVQQIHRLPPLGRYFFFSCMDSACDCAACFATKVRNSPYTAVYRRA